MSDQPHGAELKLVIPRAEAEQKLAARIREGQDLAQRNIRTEQELEDARHDYYTWHEYNKRLLVQIFDSSSEADSYQAHEVFLAVYPTTLSDQLEVYRAGVASDTRQLRSLVRQLELIPVANEVQTLDTPPGSIVEKSDKKVFVVHGHDEAAKQTVARFLERLDLETIILSEQASAGRTLIEKFEHFSDVAYAVALLTPDDIGTAEGVIAQAAQNNPEDNLDAIFRILQPRARQNVIFELGFFYGQLGRKRVCALLVGDVEWPSDIDGVVYIAMKGDWQLSLARELREAGLDADLNRAL